VLVMLVEKSKDFSLDGEVFSDYVTLANQKRSPLTETFTSP